MEKPRNTLNRREFLTTALVAGGAVGVSTLGTPALVLAKSNVRIGYLPILDHLVPLVSHARDDATFKKIHIEPKLFKSWSTVAGALKAGVIDGACLLSNFAMALFDEGLAINSILIAHRHGSGITVKKDAPIYTPQDLKGRKIAVPAMVSPHTVLLDAYLRTGGVSLQDIEVKVIAPSNMVKALERDRIEAFIVAEPFCAKAEAEGAGRTLILSKEIVNHHICCTVVVKQEVLNANPEGIQEWVSSMIASGAFIERDKVQNGAKNIAQIVANYMPHSTQVVVNALLHPNDRITYGDLNPRISDYQAILDLSLRTGILHDIDLQAFVDNKFFQAIAGTAGAICS